MHRLQCLFNYTFLYKLRE